MGQIRRKQSFGIIRGEEEKEPISYCPTCEQNGVRSILGARVYLPSEVYSKEDSERFKQCHECGEIVPIYEVKRESRLKDIVDPTDSPFDQGKSMIGLGNKKRLTPTEKKYQKLKERIEKEKDEDIKRELRKGNIVQIIENSLDY